MFSKYDSCNKSGQTIVPRHPLSHEPSDQASKRSGPSDCGSVGSLARFIVDPSHREPSSRADSLAAPLALDSCTSLLRPARVGALVAPATPAHVAPAADAPAAVLAYVLSSAPAEAAASALARRAAVAVDYQHGHRVTGAPSTT